MARGWESKSVEDQMAAAQERKSPVTRVRTPDEIARESRRQGLLLSRAKVLADMAHVRDDRHRESLQLALDYIDSQMKAL